MKKNVCYTALPAIVLSMLLAGNAGAEDTVSVAINNTKPAKQDSEATRLKARSLVNPLQAPDTSNLAPEEIRFDDTAAEIAPPGAKVKNKIVSDDSQTTRAYGSFGVPYTTSRVESGSTGVAGLTAANYLSTTYPYRAIGRLTFNNGTATYSCSASLIRRSVIVTAAHCVQKFGSGSSIYANFQFRPGQYGTYAPYGAWNGIMLTRSSTWMNGTDTGSGSARNNDVAVIALGKNSAGQFIGDITGYLGYGWNGYSFVTSAKTGNLSTAAVSTLGYPAMMDSGLMMQRTDGPTYMTTVSGAYQMYQGSNLTGGSSGGPWIVNFYSKKAVLSGGAVEGTQPDMAVIGVTSWGSANPNNPKDNYSSQFRQNAQFPNASYGVYGAGNIGALLNGLCSSAAPGGGTFASQGYCN